ncbi:hypothetical protein [Micromonospora taraxaci]|uniref:hypothetical protein n=1 Tax=Micromonospora taraxaci TaxID=1316803 RepID=UPI0033ABDA90
MAGIWRDFAVAALTAFRRRDARATADERRRAVERLAEETIRREQRGGGPSDPAAGRPADSAKRADPPE